MPPSPLLLRLESTLRETPLFGFLALHFVHLIVWPTAVLLILLLKCGTSLKSLFLLPILYGILFLVETILDDLYFPLLITVLLVFLLIFLRMLTHRWTRLKGHRMRLDQVLSKIQILVVVGFVLYMVSTELLLTEPITYFKTTGTIPQKLCPFPKSNSTELTAFQQERPVNPSAGISESRCFIIRFNGATLTTQRM